MIGSERKAAARTLVLALILGLTLVLGRQARAQASPAMLAGTSSKMVNIVAAENFYGDISTQLCAGHCNITSIISDPNADPHEYESDTGDAKAIAGAQLVIENGVGYDDFMDKLMSASPSSSRIVVNVGNMVGRKEGDNPHLWYNVDYVKQVIGAVTPDLEQIDPADTADYQAANAKFIAAMQPLLDEIATIKAQYAGYRVAETEPVAGYMMTSLGISVDDGDFQHAIEEGTDPTPQSVAAIQEQIKDRHVTVLLYNEQTISSVNDDLQQLAHKSNVPVVPVTETQPPSESSWQNWMVDQLNTLAAALAQGPAA